MSKQSAVAVRAFQQSDRTAHVPTASELERAKVWGSNPPKYDHIPNDRLRIEINSRFDGRRRSWSDGANTRLEEKLPEIFVEVAYRHEQAQQRRAEADALEQQREVRRQAALERAKLLLRESHRAEVLARQATDWRRAGELRQYADAMAATIESMPDAEQRSAATEWLQWARQHIEDLNPLKATLRLPDDPEMTLDALRPFL